MQQTKGRTTIHLTMPHIRVNLPTPAAVTIIAFCVFAIAGIVGKVSTTPATKAPEPIILIATPAPAAIVAPTAIPQAVVFQQQPAQPAPQRMVVAFGGPDTSTVLGPIPEPAVSAITGRWGDTFVSTIWQGNTVWIRVADLGANLTNAMPSAPQVQPAAPIYQPAPQYQISNQGPPPQAPEPTPAAAAAAAVVAAPVNAPAAQAPVQQDDKIHPAFPTRDPASKVDPVTYSSIQEEWKAEHCANTSDPTTCH